MYTNVNISNGGNRKDSGAVGCVQRSKFDFHKTTERISRCSLSGHRSKQTTQISSKHAQNVADDMSSKHPSHLERKKCNIPSISHSFCTSRRKQFHLKWLVVAHLLLSRPARGLWLIGSSHLGGLAHCYSPWPDPSQGGVCILRRHILHHTPATDWPLTCADGMSVQRWREQTLCALCLKVGSFGTIKLPAQL